MIGELALENVSIATILATTPVSGHFHLLTVAAAAAFGSGFNDSNFDD